MQEALETMDLEWLDLTQLAGLLTALPDEREAALVKQYLQVGWMCILLAYLLQALWNDYSSIMLKGYHSMDKASLTCFCPCQVAAGHV